MNEARYSKNDRSIAAIHFACNQEIFGLFYICEYLLILACAKHYVCLPNFHIQYNLVIIEELMKNFLLCRFQLKHPTNDESISIRDQKSRWGSCSSDKSINLNFKLIFLPKHLMTHIMIHELCHIKYLNHSDKFWNLVSRYDPEWKEHRRELRHAEKFIPNWI